MLKKVKSSQKSNANLVKTQVNPLFNIKLVDVWKLAFNPNGRDIFTAGELGKIIGYDIQAPDEAILTLKSTDIFATCITFVNY